MCILRPMRVNTFIQKKNEKRATKLLKKSGAFGRLVNDMLSLPPKIIEAIIDDHKSIYGEGVPNELEGFGLLFRDKVIMPTQKEAEAILKANSKARSAYPVTIPSRQVQINE